MFPSVQDSGLRFDELALVLAAVGALALGLKDFAMKRKGRASHDNTRASAESIAPIKPLPGHK